MGTISKRDIDVLNCQECKHYNNGEGELYCLHKCQKQKAIEPLKEETNHLCRLHKVPPKLLTNKSLAELQVYPTLSFFLKECDVVEATMFLQYYLLSLSYEEIAKLHNTYFKNVDRKIKKVLIHVKKSISV